MIFYTILLGCLMTTFVMAVNNRRMTGDGDECDKGMSVFNVFASTSVTSSSSYFLFSFDSNQNAVVVGEGSDSSDVNEWCLFPGEYVLFVDSKTEDAAFSVCNGLQVPSNSFVMFTLDDFGFCDLKIQGDAGQSVTRGLEDSQAMAFSMDMSMGMSMDASMGMSMDTSMDIFSMGSMYDSLGNSYGSMAASFGSYGSMHMSMYDSLGNSYGSMAASFGSYGSMDMSSDMSMIIVTDIPTATPTTMPTATPSTAPTRAPTRSPTMFLPSAVPTARPSRLPTSAPTTFLSTFTVSSFTASCMSTCSYTDSNGQTVPYSTSWTGSQYCTFYTQSGCTRSLVEDYACVPRCMESCPSAYCNVFAYTAVGCSGGGNYDSKNSVENSCVASYGEQNDAETDVEFGVGIGYDGMDASNVSSAVNSTIDAIASSMDGVTNEDITFDGTETYDNGRRLTSGIKLNFIVNVIAEDLGYTADTADEAWSNLNEQLTQSVNNGNFQQFVTTSLQNNGLSSKTVGNGVDASALAIGTPTITIIATSAPTMAPTSGKKHDDDDVDEGVIIGAVIGSVVGFALIIFVVYYFYYMESQEEKELAFKQATKLRATESQRQDEDYL